jgi:hypothetical protein
MNTEFWTKLMLVITVLMVGFSLTSCNDNDDTQTQVYTFGWDDYSASGSDLSFLSEMATVEAAFKSALGSGSPVTITGSTADCDTKIKAACEWAAASLKGKTWGFSGLYTVINQTSGKVVYSLQFTQGNSL